MSLPGVLLLPGAVSAAQDPIPFLELAMGSHTCRITLERGECQSMGRKGDDDGTKEGNLGLCLWQGLERKDDDDDGTKEGNLGLCLWQGCGAWAQPVPQAGTLP